MRAPRWLTACAPWQMCSRRLLGQADGPGLQVRAQGRRGRARQAVAREREARLRSSDQGVPAWRRTIPSAGGAAAAAEHTVYQEQCRGGRRRKEIYRRDRLVQALCNSSLIPSYVPQFSRCGGRKRGGAAELCGRLSARRAGLGRGSCSNAGRGAGGVGLTRGQVTDRCPDAFLREVQERRKARRGRSRGSVPPRGFLAAGHVSGQVTPLRHPRKRRFRKPGGGRRDGPARAERCASGLLENIIA